ncbi:MAG: hypothetical protein ACLTT1_16155 [[Clostridium] scindens]
MTARVNQYELDDMLRPIWSVTTTNVSSAAAVSLSVKRCRVSALSAPTNRGFSTYIGSAFDMGLGETSCVSCGQCIAVCPDRRSI